MKTFFITCTLSAAALLGPLCWNAAAQVVINGYLVQGNELAQLEYLVGGAIPPGRYWLDVNTGDWGYEGNPYVQGNVFYSQTSGYGDSGSSGQVDSYYSTGGAGGYGSYVSDGECAYFSTGDMSMSTCD